MNLLNPTLLEQTRHSNSAVSSKIVFVGRALSAFIAGELIPASQNNIQILSPDNFPDFLNSLSLLTIPDIILLEAAPDGLWEKAVKDIRNNTMMSGIIIVLLSSTDDKTIKQHALNMRVHDLYHAPFPVEDICERLNFLVKFKLIRPRLLELSRSVDLKYEMPFIKRAFDLLAAGSALLVLSPLLLIIAILIKLDSKGPIFYISKRVGTGYKIFDFYKFRSMRTDADKLISQLSANNQYAAESKGKAAFVKIKNDPRITKLGNFLRNTSIDELPQLLNVLKGDMSLVGNRPLPLYEAEMLTSNEWTTRFLGPAGLTGLWQISKRGKEDMSERERKKLDNFYARKYSFWFDMKIIFSTIPALFQKEKV